MLLSLVPEIHGPVGAGVSHTAPARRARPTAIAAPPASSCRPAASAAARRDPQPRARSPGTTISAAAILASKPSPTPRRRARASACARPRARAPATTARRRSSSTSSASGLLWREIATRDRREREHRPGDEAGRAAERPAHQVVGQPDGRDAHQRLRHEHAPRAEAEHARGQRLDPQRERRLVDGHHARRVERAVQERVPAGAHRAHGGAVVLVGEAVAAERPQVQHGREREQHGERSGTAAIATAGVRWSGRARAGGGQDDGVDMRVLRGSLARGVRARGLASGSRRRAAAAGEDPGAQRDVAGGRRRRWPR